MNHEMAALIFFFAIPLEYQVWSFTERRNAKCEYICLLNPKSLTNQTSFNDGTEMGHSEEALCNLSTSSSRGYELAIAAHIVPLTFETEYPYII